MNEQRRSLKEDFKPDLDNPYLYGLNDNADKPSVLQETVSGLFNRFRPIQQAFDKVFGPAPEPTEHVVAPIIVTHKVASTYRGPVEQLQYYEEDSKIKLPVVKYEEMLRSMQEAELYQTTWTWQKRYNAMVSIINGNQKAGITAIHTNAYGLVLKLVDAGELYLAQALDLEIEAEDFNYFL
jgi:hypothetical protein